MKGCLSGVGIDTEGFFSILAIKEGKDGMG